MTRTSALSVVVGIALVVSAVVASKRTGPGGAQRAERAGPPVGALAEPPSQARPAPSSLQAEATDERDFEVIVDGHRILRLPLESAFVLPGEPVEILTAGAPAEAISLKASAGTLTRTDTESWSWIPPEEEGYADLVVAGPGARKLTLRAWTTVPLGEVEGGRLGSFRVGSYPVSPLGDNPIYLPPPGLVRVTEENHDVRVSPHFLIGHFVSKQPGSYPKFLILRPQLLLKMELLLEALADRGYPIESFHVMSGYRTPFYNVQVLGNVQYSRHQWGGAADIFVDERPRNGYMDDLDGDGRVGLSDIAVITDVVDSLEQEFDGFPIGGAGVYRANSVRGPFVHIDVRGVAARW